MMTGLDWGGDVAPLELKICFGDWRYKYAGPLDLVEGPTASGVEVIFGAATTGR